MAWKGGSKIKDLTGQQFGKLTVLGLDHMDDHGTSYWTCKCECGNTKVIARTSLVRGTTVSCGCYAREQSSKRSYKHGGHSSLLYSIWQAMKHRCYTPTASGYDNYGGRGITVCSEWRDNFVCFRDWAVQAGYSEESGLTLDRIDVDGNYEPSNCRWVTMRTQNNNKTTNRIIEYKGHRKTIAEWARFLEVNPQRLRYRLNRCNDDLELACSFPMPLYRPAAPKCRRAHKTLKQRQREEWNIPVLYKLWWRVKKSCCDPNNERYASYGAKGITICDSWKESFHAFQEWCLATGYKEKQGLVLHRIDPAGPYSPENCKWVSRSENTTIRSRQVQLTYQGRTQNLTQWAAELDISPTTLMYRIGQYGGDIAKAIEHKKGKHMH